MKTADELADELKQALGVNLISAVLYGSAVTGDTTRRFSDVDVFLLLNNTDLPAIRPGLAILRKWMKAGNKTPLLFSLAHFERAADVFAIELADIKDHHRLLTGTDPFKDLRIERDDLRRQLEFELRSNVLRLRRHYLETGDSPKALALIMGQSLSTLATLFRTALRLQDKPVPPTKKETWQSLNQLVPMDMAALEKIWDLRQDGVKLDAKTADDLFQRLVRTLESVINFVDAQT